MMEERRRERPTDRSPRFDPPRSDQTRFIYFDLGNVLLSFDHQRAARQMAAVAGITFEEVWEVVFGSGFHLRYERGEFSTAGFHERFCRQTGSTPALEPLAAAASDIFEPIPAVITLLDQLSRAGYRLGLLSNTNDAHWSFILATFPELPRWFEVLALSFELKSLKPEPEIYRQAASLAGVAPEEILFIDDRPENVSGAVAAHFAAIHFQGYDHLVAELIARGFGPFH